MRCSARTLTPALTASDAHVCRRSCGVMSCTFALLTADVNHPPSDLGRYPRGPANTRSSGALPAHPHRQLVEDEHRHRHRAGLAALGRTDSMVHAELYRVLRKGEP